MTAPALPRLLLVADGFTRPDVAARVVALARAGVPWVQLRDHAADDDAFDHYAAALAERLRAAAPGVVLSINSRLPTAVRLGAGLHTGVHGPTLAEARAMRPPGTRVGASVHGLDEARRAADAGADYLVFSPVFPTGSKPGHPGAGLDALAAVCAAVPCPTLALGGVTPARAAACRAAGAHGVAVLSGLLHAADPAAATARYLR